MGDLQTIIESRRSAMNFIEGVPFADEDIQQLFSLNKLVPSAFNLQHAHYLVVTNPEEKNKVYEASHQYKVKTASAVIIVLGDTKAYEHVAEMNEGMLALGMMSKFDFDRQNEDVLQMYEGRGEGFQRDEAIRNASLSAMQLMLIAKDLNWDTCPMIGFDPDKLQELFHIPQKYVPTMLITIGKSDPSKLRPRGYRKPLNEYVSINSFTGH